MDFLDIATDILIDSVKDTLYLIPFLLVTYLLMEWLEHKTGERTQNAIRKAGAAGPVVGSLLGVIPQCGFSASAATLYAGRVITLGTLYAVFLSTSDEMLPIFLAKNVPVNTILLIMGSKVVIGMLAGFVTDALLRIADRQSEKFRIHELCIEDDCGCQEDCEACQENPELVYEHREDALRKVLHDDGHDGEEHGGHHDGEHHQVGAHEHTHDGSHGWGHIFKSALVHTLKVTVFVFAITLALNIILAVVGEDVLASLLGSDSIASVFISGLVGLIPNCAASVLIADLYVDGILGSGAMLSGLLVSAGIGLLVLVRTNKNLKQNLGIILGLYCIGVLCGLICIALKVSFL